MKRKVSLLCFFCFCGFCRRSRRFSFCSEVYYCTCRTFLGTKTTVLAFFRVNHGEIVLNLDSVKLASLFALLASYAAVGTSFPCLGARISGMTLNDNLALCRSDSDDMVRTSIGTYAASYAHVPVDNSHTVANLYRAVRTCCLADSQT